MGVGIAGSALNIKRDHCSRDSASTRKSAPGVRPDNSQDVPFAILLMQTPASTFAWSNRAKKGSLYKPYKIKPKRDHYRSFNKAKKISLQELAIKPKNDPYISLPRRTRRDRMRFNRAKKESLYEPVIKPKKACK